MAISFRMIRRLVILIAFIAVFMFTSFGIKTITDKPPTCDDGIMNGDEEGADCGLFACGIYCEPDLNPPQVISTKLIETSSGEYDLIAVIVNPHTQFGSSEISYSIKLYNGGNEEVLSDGGVFYLLPGQTKYLILPALTTEKNVNRTEFEIESAKWRRLDFTESLGFSIRNDKYTIASDGKSSSLEGILFNDSDFDFSLVDIDIILLDANGQIIAANHTDVRTLLARTERQFKAIWPFLIKGGVAKVDIRPSTNLFENSNFIKFYGTSPEQFQEY